MTQADILRAVMIYTWDGYDPAEIKGRLNPRNFENACEVAQTLGGQIANNPIHGDVHECLFPDGSTINIVVKDDGVGSGLE